MSTKKPVIAALAVLSTLALVAGAADAKGGRRPKPKRNVSTTTAVVSTTTSGPGSSAPNSSTSLPVSSTTSTGSSIPALADADTLIDIARSGQRLGNHPKRARDFKLYVNETLVATTIGITDVQLHDELHTGLSVSQVAVNHGSTAGQVSAALTTDVTAQINAALAAGSITQARATQLLGDLSITITNYVNRVHYVRPPKTTTTSVVTTTTVAPTTTPVTAG